MPHPPTKCLRANRALIELQQQGYPYAQLAASRVGAAVSLQGLGWQLLDGESTPVLDPAARQQTLQRAVENFSGQHLPRFHDLGALPAEGAAWP